MPGPISSSAGGLQQCTPLLDERRVVAVDVVRVEREAERPEAVAPAVTARRPTPGVLPLHEVEREGARAARIVEVRHLELDLAVDAECGAVLWTGCEPREGREAEHRAVEVDRTVEIAAVDREEREPVVVAGLADQLHHRPVGIEACRTP